MPGDPEQCRLNARRCLALANRARTQVTRANLATMAGLWTKLAAETEFDQRFSARSLS